MEPDVAKVMYCLHFVAIGIEVVKIDNPYSGIYPPAMSTLGGKPDYSVIRTRDNI